MAHNPFLNEYKYTLARRRILQTITGGVRIQSLPIPLHILQWLLWILPLAISVPFIATGNLWNPYYSGLTYATLCGLLTLSITCTVKFIYWKSSTPQLLSIDEEDSTISITFCGALNLIFPQKNWLDIIVHTISSGLTCFSSLTLLNVFVMKGALPIPAVVIVFIAGALALCTGHYSLVATPPNEISIYRQCHLDRLHLNYLRRPLYVVLIGILFVVLRNSVGSSYLIIPYVLHSVLPILWPLGVLPPLDALVFWLMEQTLIHLMGGTAAASELRILAHFSLKIIPMTIIIATTATDRFVMSLLATGLGFLLSQNVIHWLTFASSNVLKYTSKIHYKLTISFSSYWFVDFRQIKSTTQTLVWFLIGSLKGVALIATSLIITSQTYGRGSGTSLRDKIVMGVAYIIISTFLISRCARVFSGAFICWGLVRNPFHSLKTEPLRALNRRRSLAIYLSIPSQVITLYVAPLLMVTYVGLVLDRNRVDSSVWFGITTFRLYRKIWQNPSLCLTELSISAVLFVSLSTSSSWSSLDIGTQTFLIGVVLHIINNLLERLIFFAILFISFLSSYSKDRVFFVSLIISLACLPLSFFSLFISAIVSAPLLPFFTLPILLMTFPRPQAYWPALLSPKALNQTYESSYYKQALPAFSKSIANAFKTGTFHTVNTGTYLLMRFQDRLSVIRLLERGYGYCLIHVQGLELQETSCHTTEAASIDEIHESLYVNNGSRMNCLSWFNRYPLYHLQPIDASIGRVYSDARNSLTGIIDSHDSLRRFSQNLYKTLIWIFAGYVKNNKGDVWSMSNGVSPDPVPSYASWSTGRRTSCSLQVDARSINSNGSVVSPSHVVFRSSKVSPIYPTSTNGTLPLSLPLTERELSKVATKFPHEWFKRVSNHYTVDSSVFNRLKNLVTTCFVLTDVPACSSVLNSYLSSHTQPGHIYKGFCSNHSTPLGNDASKYKKWIKENDTVGKLANKAYRYAVKLLYDEAVLGEMSDDCELMDTLVDYDTNWHIEQEGNTEEWERNVIRETRSLFSIGHDQNCYTAHVLTLQDEILFTGQLSQSLIEGVWSNLSFELQYLTNDDEERYSVQAQPRLLRNLVTQGAAVPYGYQIFSSDLITIPTV